MNKIIIKTILITIALTMFAIPTQAEDVFVNNHNLKIDAYGPGVHMNSYGQAVILKPDFGGVPGEHLEIRENAYGLGIHSDQYGRPVREYPVR